MTTGSYDSDTAGKEQLLDDGRERRPVVPYKALWAVLLLGWIVSYADRTLTGPVRDRHVYRDGAAPVAADVDHLGRLRGPDDGRWGLRFPRSQGGRGRPSRRSRLAGRARWRDTTGEQRNAGRHGQPTRGA